MKKNSKKWLSLFFVLAIVLSATLVGIAAAEMRAAGDPAPRAAGYYDEEYYYTSGTQFISDIAVSARDHSGTASGRENEAKGYITGAGYTLLGKDLNDGKNSSYIHMGYKKSTDESQAIRAIAFYNGGTAPASFNYTINGYSCTFYPVLNSYIGSSTSANAALDLNREMGGDTIYMYYTRDPNAGPPMTRIEYGSNATASGLTSCLWMNTGGSKGQINQPADLNAGGGGDYIYLYYAQENSTEVDTDALRTAATNGNNYLSNAGNYVSVYNLQTAVNSANNIINDYNSYGLSGQYDQNAINNAINPINTAINALQTRVNLNPNGGSLNGSTSTYSTTITIGGASSYGFSVASYVPVRTGYTFKGWATSASATSGSTGTINVGFNNTLYAVWEANKYTVVFDNLVDFSKWNTSSASNGTFSNVTENGFTLTSNDGAGEGTSQSPLFPVTPGKQYKIDIDFTGDAWDVYIFFYDANTSSGLGLEFNDGPTNRYSANGSTGITADNAVFTAPAGAVRAAIRVDANGSNNTVRFENIRVYEVGTVEDGVSYENSKTVTFAGTYGDLPVPTKTNHEFLGWYKADGTKLNASDTVNVADNLYVTSKWKMNGFTVTWKNYDGTVLETDNGVPAGTTPTYNGNTPTRPATAEYTYTFTSWTPAVSAITGDTTYTAQYSQTKNKYNVTWKVDGQQDVVTSVEYGTVPAYPNGTPTKAADAQYTYTFSSWSPEVVAVTKDATYTAQFGTTTKTYTVTWVVEGTTVETDNDVPYGTTPTYDGDEPTKAADSQYTYAFAGWNPTVDKITGHTQYEATFTPTLRSYTVNWVVNDQIVETDTVEYGKMPEYNGSEPTKAATAQYSYKFDKWSPTVTTVSGDVNYTATFTQTVNKYKVTWVDEDGSTVLYSADFDYGAMPVYGAENPTKAATAQYTYTFDGWDRAYEAVTGTATYTAKYKATVNKYTIKFVNEDGTELQSSEVAYGETPVYTGETPTKAATAQYTYTHNGWTPEIAEVTEDATYTATYSSTVNKYTITFVDEDGTELQSSEVAYGETPAYTGETPTKEATAQYTYTFAGWDPAIAEVTEDATYTATYSSTVNKYTITFVNEDGDELYSAEFAYGATPAYTGETPTKEATAQYTYTFAGWDPEIADVTGEATYTAQFDATVNTYTVTWVDEDGSVLETDKDVPYGATPEFDGETPSKAADAQYTYAFDKWSPEIATVTGDATYKATYSSTVNTYTVTWKNEDGTVLKTDAEVAYGTTPEYKGSTPTKAKTDEFTYTFAGWTPEISEVTGDAVYTATYKAEKNKYTITWVIDGKEETTSVEYGAMPTHADPVKAADAQYTYTFTGWTPEIKAVTGNATYTAQFSSTVNKYTVTWIIDGKTETETYEYGATPSHADPVKEADAQYTYTFKEWSPAIATVTGDATYTAQFSSTVNKYTVTWVIDGKETTEEYEYGAMPTHDEPTKAADAQYTYTFKAWSPAIAKVEKDATYTAVFDKTVNEYTITWIVDGEETTTTVAYGETPDFGSTPTKEATAEFSYTFKEWTPAVVAVTGDATYEAVFTATTNAYTVTWVDEDGTLLETDENVLYGATPEFNQANPTKEKDAQYEYAFAGWAPSVSTVTGNVEYKATYSSTVRSYEIKWVVDGNTVRTDILEYGQMPVFGEDPTKAETDEYTYTFAGWDNEVVAVTGPATYTAEFTADKRSYTITWIVDGNETTTTVKYGETPALDDPTKAPSAEYTYTFKEWTPAIKAVTGDATYTAVFTETPNVYTITWVGYNKTVTTDVAYGAQIVDIPEVPVQTGYIGVWENVPQTMPATNITINAKYSQNVITVTWIVNGVTVKTDAVEYGNKPEFTGATPVKAPSNTEVYEFIGWAETEGGELVTVFPEASAETGNKTYHAVFEGSTRYYTITWNIEGTTTTEKYEYDAMPEYTGATPTKAATAQYTYTFDGWDPAVAKVTGDATYTAQFKATVNTYTVTWIIDGKTETETYAYGAMPTHAEPTKAATAQYTYTFAGWDPAITTVTGDVTYTAKFNATVNKYTVTWVDENGTVLETDTGVEFGTKPTFDKANPTKAATAQYTYTFAGWEGLTADTTVEGNVTFKAKYTSTVNKYTVTWVIDGKTETETYEYGATPSHADPTKAADAQYTYAFKGWTPEIKSVTGDATYTAQFSSTVNKYTVTWNVEGQNPVVEEIEYGTTPAYPNGTPTKQGNAQYSYKFTGWTPVVSEVTGNAIYTAQFDAIVNTYTVTWDVEGAKTTETYEYGATPAYPNGTPTKQGNAQYTYTFAGWDKELATVTGNATYTAQFSSTVNTYTVTWDIDGAKTTETYEYGAKPEYKGDEPTKTADAQYTYTFAGWNGLTSETTVTGDVTFTAKFDNTVNMYTITWKNADGTVIKSESVAYGTTPSYVGETPVKSGNAQYSYTFAGWTPVIAEVTEDAEYTATFTPVVNKYTVTWIVEGKTVETDTNVPYGTKPTFNGSTPSKAATAQYTYTFAGWDPVVSDVTGNVTYNATFTPVIRSYTVTWANEDGTVITTDTVEYGTMASYTGATPTKAATAQYTFTFAGWDKPFAEVKGDVTYTATYTSTVNKYTVTWVVEGTTVETDENVEYGKTPSYDGDEPTKAGDAQYSYTFDKWTPEVSEVTGNVTYTATFTQSVNKYTITWIVNGAETTQQVEYGTVPTFTGSTDKAPDNTTVYTFAGWDNEVVAVTGNATYTATYSEADRLYTITWVVGDNTTTEQYKYNEVPSFKGSTDIPSTESTTYVFKGWNKEIANVTEDATYTAEYDVTVKTHTITWIVGDHEIKQQWAYGTVPTFDGSTDKAPSATATYTFAGWDKTPVKVTADATYTAMYTETPRMYTVTWIVDGNVVKTEAVAYNAVIPVPGLPADKEGHTVKWDNTVTVMPASDVEIHAIYTPRMYPVYWIVDGITVYSASVPYGTAIPEKAVPAKEGHTGKWLNVPATMPAGIVMINAEYTARSYQVFWKFGDAQGTDTATYSVDYVLTLDIANLPEDVRVTVNGVVLSADNYEYDAAAGTLKIYGTAITGNINIVAKSTSGSVNVLNSIFGGTSSNTNSVINMRTTYHTTITPAAGNLLPKTVAIYVDGILVTNGYSYDPATGKLTINAEVIVGELEIYAECPEDPNYNPTEDCDCSCHSKNALVKFFFTIFNFLRELFGMKQYQYCECGVAHW